METSDHPWLRVSCFVGWYLARDEGQRFFLSERIAQGWKPLTFLGRAFHALWAGIFSALQASEVFSSERMETYDFQTACIRTCVPVVESTTFTMQHMLVVSSCRLLCVSVCSLLFFIFPVFHGFVA